MNKAIISAGSNIDPEENVKKARIILSQEHTLIDESAFVRTKPQGFVEQPDFINGAFCINTELDLEKLKIYVKEVESRLGRIRTENKDGPRTIDLDVVVFNGSIVNEDYYKYDFVNKSVNQLIPKEDVEIDQEVIANSFRDILEKGLKIDLNDPNFRETPERVARSFAEIFSGLGRCDEDIEKLFSQCFPTNYRGIVAEKEITVFSMCPHHFLPVRYKVSVGYIPTECGLGLSKLARIIELLAKKPVLQETFTQEIIDLIDKHVKPFGAICVVEGQHYCMQMRGAKQKDVVTTTSAASGTFLTKPEMEIKFYELIKDK